MAEGKSSKPTVDREKTCPFLLRTFVRSGSFHPLSEFEGGTPPSADEHHLYTWRDATLRELITALRASSPTAFRHPLARFSFRVIFIHPGRVGSKDLGIIHARELANPSTLTAIEDEDEKMDAPLNGHPDDRTLEELRLVPGDFLDVAIMTPHMGRAIAAAQTAATQGPAPAFGIRGMGGRGAPPPVGRGGPGRGADSGWGGGLGNGRGRDEGGHWRGRAGPISAGPGRGAGRGADREGEAGGDRRGGFGRRMGGDRDRGPDREPDRDRDRDRDARFNGRAPLPRRDREEDMKVEDDDRRDRKRRRSPSYSPAPRRTPSRSRSPPRRRDSFKDRD